MFFFFFFFFFQVKTQFLGGLLLLTIFVSWQMEEQSKVQVMDPWFKFNFTIKTFSGLRYLLRTRTFNYFEVIIFFKDFWLGSESTLIQNLFSFLYDSLFFFNISYLFVISYITLLIMLAICSKINLEKLPWNSFWKRMFHVFVHAVSFIFSI